MADFIYRVKEPTRSSQSPKSVQHVNVVVAKKTPPVLPPTVLIPARV